jgi:hypothetical protein
MNDPICDLRFAICDLAPLRIGGSVHLPCKVPQFARGKIVSRLSLSEHLQIENRKQKIA